MYAIAASRASKLGHDRFRTSGPVDDETKILKPREKMKPPSKRWRIHVGKGPLGEGGGLSLVGSSPEGLVHRFCSNGTLQKAQHGHGRHDLTDCSWIKELATGIPGTDSVRADCRVKCVNITAVRRQAWSQTNLPGFVRDHPVLCRSADKVPLIPSRCFGGASGTLDKASCAPHCSVSLSEAPRSELATAASRGLQQS
ncbi:hypothetical protein BKA80DRAFT_67316 [Phyllosticta citrichinensis]